MKIVKKYGTALLIKYKKFKDNRGFFYSSFNSDEFKKIIKLKKINFLQENFSYSKKNVIRGMHYQTKPYEQGKLIRVIKGEILDVIININKNSKFYKKKYYINLKEHDQKLLWVPIGYAHGFLAKKNGTLVQYITDNIYSKRHEKCIKWNDLDLNIKWNVKKVILSKKDLLGDSFSNI